VNQAERLNEILWSHPIASGEALIDPEFEAYESTDDPETDGELFVTHHAEDARELFRCAIHLRAQGVRTEPVLWDTGVPALRVLGGVS